MASSGQGRDEMKVAIIPGGDEYVVKSFRGASRTHPRPHPRRRKYCSSRGPGTRECPLL